MRAMMPVRAVKTLDVRIDERALPGYKPFCTFFIHLPVQYCLSIMLWEPTSHRPLYYNLKTEKCANISQNLAQPIFA